MQQHLPPSSMSASEDYQPPNPHDLAALLSKGYGLLRTLSRSRDPEFSSQESTLFIAELLLGADY
ncbi:hypothetical protein GJ744_001827 [Endocarpon pusillum]|uniref:Uncharacterized protein n=1 Tax=Endocarpon pusillum TaxID=364733 RepID=A0A8H7E6I0_9EURO|nr:hypothetical protein GJ744_001827 [Endocarpon pusillum]